MRIKNSIGVATTNLKKPKSIGSISSVALFTTINELAQIKDIRINNEYVKVLFCTKEVYIELFINTYNQKFIFKNMVNFDCKLIMIIIVKNEGNGCTTSP